MNNETNQYVNKWLYSGYADIFCIRTVFTLAIDERVLYCTRESAKAEECEPAPLKRLTRGPHLTSHLKDRDANCEPWHICS